METVNFTTTPVAFYASVEGDRQPRSLSVEVRSTADPEGKLFPPQRVFLDLQSRSLLHTQIERAVSWAKVSIKADKKLLDAELLDTAAKALAGEEPIPYFSRQGMSRLPDGHYVYVAGGEVLGSAVDPRVGPEAVTAELRALRLAPCDEATADTQAVRDLYKLLFAKGNKIGSLAGPGFVLFLYMFLGAVRTELAREGLTTFPTIMLVGPPGTRKTSAVRTFCLLYDKNGVPWGTFDANADKPKNIMAELRGAVNRCVLFDDLTVAGTEPTEARKREANATELLRTVANAVPPAVSSGRDAGGFCGGAVLTGEYPLSGASTNDRTLILEVKEPIAHTSESVRLLVASVFRQFLAWAADHWTELLNTCLDGMKSLNECAEPRQGLACELFLWACNCFYDCLENSTGIKPKAADKMRKQSIDLLIALFARQYERVSRLSQAQPEGNAAYYIRKLFSGHEIPLAKSPGKWKPDVQAILKDDILYAKPELLASLMRKTPLHIGGEKSLGKALDRLGILAKQEQGKHTVKFRGTRVFALSMQAVFNGRDEYSR